jgi:hypothetical protein
MEYELTNDLEVDQFFERVNKARKRYNESIGLTKGFHYELPDTPVFDEDMRSNSKDFLDNRESDSREDVEYLLNSESPKIINVIGQQFTLIREYIYTANNRDLYYDWFIGPNNNIAEMFIYETQGTHLFEVSVLNRGSQRRLLPELLYSFYFKTFTDITSSNAHGTGGQAFWRSILQRAKNTGNRITLIEPTGERDVLPGEDLNAFWKAGSSYAESLIKLYR